MFPVLERKILLEIAEQGHSLNPGRYVGVTEREEEDVDYSAKIEEMHSELEKLNEAAKKNESNISINMRKILNV